MKKSTLLKLAFTLVAIFVFAGLYAQNPPAPYVLYDANKVAPTNVDYVTLKTGGTTMGYYALPDPIYHPNYVAAGTLAAGFVWNWSVVPAMTVNKPGAANYAQIVFTATGNYAVNVNEQADAAFGGCAGANTLMNVTVVSPPTFTISAPALASICGTQAAQTISVAIVENVPVANASYAFRVTEEIDEIDASNVVINDGAEGTFAGGDFPIATKLQAVGGAQPNYTWTINTSNLAVNNLHRTRYVYRFHKPTGAPVAATEGFVSAISQKSDYVTPGIAALNTYPFASGNAQVTLAAGVATITYIVNPAPVTGPIYHISNTYAY